MQAKYVNNVFAFKSSSVSALLVQDRRVNRVFFETSRLVSAFLQQSNVFSAVEFHDDKPEADSQFLKEACEQIRIAAEDMDCDRLEDIFADIERYKIPTKYESLWKQLKKALGQYDYDKLLSLLPKED